MAIETILTMAVAIGVVWGGFATALIMALRMERRKSSQEENSNDSGHMP